MAFRFGARNRRYVSHAASFRFDSAYRFSRQRDNRPRNRGTSAMQYDRLAAKRAIDTTPRITRMNSGNSCRQCGNRLFMPEWSEWRDSGHAHHLWQCDACGFAFETRVYLAAA
jgi:hypothetical protein